MRVSNAMNVKGILELMSIVSHKDYQSLERFSEPATIKSDRIIKLKPPVETLPPKDVISFALLTSDPYDYLSNELSEVLYS